LTKIILNLILLVILSLPNIIALKFDPSVTKLAGLLVPIILFIGVGRLIPSFKRRLLWSMPLLVLSFVSLGILIQFNSQVTEGVIEAIVNSDTIEAFEFIKEIEAIVYWLMIFYVMAFIYLYIQANKFRSDSLKPIKHPWLTMMLILLPIMDMLGKGASARSYPLIIVGTVFNYVEEKASMNDLLDARKDFHFDVKKAKRDTKKETFIFVIGEASRRDYYSLYGYYRNTSPNLSALNGISVFTDAISPANTTVPSLMAVLHLSTAEDNSLFYKTKSIVSLAKEAGYKTWWISAQSRFGRYETSVTSSGIESDVKHFIEEGRTLSRGYDEALLPFIEDSLADPVMKKFIVMHLYGSHISYKKRYPESFSSFKSIPVGYENHSSKIQSRVNEYANSISYTDSVLGRLIKKADDKEQQICVVYIADHGEYLADDLNHYSFGHGSNPPYKVEVEVPLIVWCSEEYRQANPDKWRDILNNRSLPINLEDMFYSLSDLMHINYKLMKPERSFFNAKFTPLLPRKTRSSSTGKVMDYLLLK